MKTYLKILTISITLVISSQSKAVVIHVPGDSTNIQAAINGTNEGDTVLVAPGDYIEHLVFNSKSIVLLSSNGDSITYISKEYDGVDIIEFPPNLNNSSIFEELFYCIIEHF